MGVVSPRAFDFVDDLRALRDPELVLLKGHVVLEQFLVAVVAARLNTVEDEVPGLKFGALVDLAFKNSEERKYLIWLNELRNVAAHKFNALDSLQFSAVLQRFDLPWPKGNLERCILLEQLLLRFIDLALLQMLEYMRSTPPDPGDDFDEEWFGEIEGESDAARKRIAERDATLARIRHEE